MPGESQTYRMAESNILNVLEEDPVVQRHGFRVDRDLPGVVGEFLGGVVVRIVIPEGRFDEPINTSATMHWVAKLWCNGEEEWERTEPFLLNLTRDNKWGFSLDGLYSILAEAEQQGNRKPWLWQRSEYERLADGLRVHHGVEVTMHKSLARPRHYWLEIRHGEAMVRVRGLNAEGGCQIGMLAHGHVDDLPRFIDYIKRKGAKPVATRGSRSANDKSPKLEPSLAELAAATEGPQAQYTQPPTTPSESEHKKSTS